MIKPYKKFSVFDVSQGFHSGHQAIDCVSTYGKPLVAPENVLIGGIITPTNVSEDLGDLKNGYGVWMIGQETGDKYLYWHCLPVFPVWGGDIIEGGKIVAYMGNAGNVSVGGVYVPLEERTDKPYRGTHLHMVWFKNGVPHDPLPYLEKEPEYTFWDEIKATGVVLTKIKLLLK